jgi:Protein of unknown function (DUF3485)
MKPLSAFVAFLVLLAATLATGWLHGRLTNRWDVPVDSKFAADQLSVSLPSQAGNWKLLLEDKFSDEVVRVLQCPAHINRVYEHEQSGDVVNVAVIVGPPGPISVHTPEICYTSRDYTTTGERHKVSVADGGSASHTMWELPLKSNDHRKNLRVLYAWSTGTAWVAAEYPRFSYGGLPHLYKLQLSVITNPHSTSSEFDPGQDFLQHFLAQVQPQLVEATRSPAPARQ